ncbi:glycosyltransferase [Flavobacterium sp. CAU 1735]|uniref:glycosyltransferase family 2 protein n=1 Tax=Flavobacterium sp. CAU 1735 TaxID=3140361 RepID=UPI0032615B6D
MKNTLIICTYRRAQSVLRLLQSVAEQTCYPDAILIVDGSPDDETEKILQENTFQNLKYHKVSPENRGLTKQRNVGINLVPTDSDVICFLDDDTILEKDYFEALLKTYTQYPDAKGVGGYITNEVKWKPITPEYTISKNEFEYDGWVRKDGSRFVLRKKLGLDADRPPGFLPTFSHGRSVSFLPPSGKTYPVEQLMGGVSSFKKEIFQNFRFSEYFEGYGLYEDADFCLRVSKMEKLYVTTSARLEHHHDASGRPNQYNYGRMVVRNGWYVWKVAYPQTDWKSAFKWHAIIGLLLLTRISNIFTTSDRKAAFTESLGRFTGWISLLFNKPKVESGKFF